MTVAYIVRRVLMLFVVLLVALTLNFFVPRLAPGVKGGVIMYRRGGGERPGVALQNRTTRRLP